jgi:hypothetical protein
VLSPAKRERYVADRVDIPPRGGDDDREVLDLKERSLGIDGYHV